MHSIIVQASAIGLILASRVLAEPLEASQVAADATWVVHVDFDAFRSSTVVQNAWKRVLEKNPDLESSLGIVRLIMGMDPTADVHGIRAYNKGVNGEVVAILTASMDPQRLTLLASIIPGRESTKHGDYVIDSWPLKHGNPAPTFAMAFWTHSQLVMASSVDDVKATLDLLDGKAPSLTADSRLGGNIPAGTICLVRVEGLANATRPRKAPIESFRMVIGESKGQSFFRMRVTMASPKVVDYTLTAIHGGQALGNLLVADEIGRKFINAVQSRRDGPTMTVLWSVPASDVWDGLVKIEQAISKRMAVFRGHDKHEKSSHEETPSPHEDAIPARKSVPPEEDF